MKTEDDCSGAEETLSVTEVLSKKNIRIESKFEAFTINCEMRWVWWKFSKI